MDYKNTVSSMELVGFEPSLLRCQNLVLSVRLYEVRDLVLYNVLLVFVMFSMYNSEI